METIVDLEGEHQLLELAAQIAELNEPFIRELKLKELKELRNITVHKSCFLCAKSCVCRVCLLDD